MARRPRPGDANALPPEEEILALADSLDLTALKATYRAVLGEAEKEECSFTEFVLRLLRAERAARDARREERTRGRSQLGPEIGLDHFDFSARPGLDARVVRELLLCRFVLERRPLILVGPSGTGKTHVCRAIGHAAIKRGHSVLYTTAAAAVEDLGSSLVDGSYKRTLRRYAKPEVLIMDEFGVIGFDGKASKHLFRLVSERYQKGSTIVAANSGFKKWKNFFPSEAEAVATVDRLVDQATILRFSG
ncbi:MAG: IS21-like element helper ATPase IstB, partial [Planctomycetes bacterium]|nr:IS21-like element helper ATPase IstB [Planctomycetota bacterium]